jgi:hypothetical protein
MLLKACTHLKIGKLADRKSQRSTSQAERDDHASTRVGYDKIAIANIKMSFKKVGRLRKGLHCQQHPWKILSGRHSAQADKNRVRNQTEPYDVDALARRLDISHDAAEMVVTNHANIQRKVPEEETKAELLRLARQRERDGVPKDRISADLGRLLIHTRSYICELLPSEYKQRNHANSPGRPRKNPNPVFLEKQKSGIEPAESRSQAEKNLVSPPVQDPHPDALIPRQESTKESSPTLGDGLTNAELFSDVVKTRLDNIEKRIALPKVSLQAVDNGTSFRRPVGTLPLISDVHPAPPRTYQRTGAGITAEARSSIDLNAELQRELDDMRADREESTTHELFMTRTERETMEEKDRIAELKEKNEVRDRRRKRAVETEKATSQRVLTLENIQILHAMNYPPEVEDEALHELSKYNALMADPSWALMWAIITANNRQESRKQLEQAATWKGFNMCLNSMPELLRSLWANLEFQNNINPSATDQATFQKMQAENRHEQRQQQNPNSSVEQSNKDFGLRLIDALFDPNLRMKSSRDSESANSLVINPKTGRYEPEDPSRFLLGQSKSRLADVTAIIKDLRVTTRKWKDRNHRRMKSPADGEKVISKLEETEITSKNQSSTETEGDAKIGGRPSPKVETPFDSAEANFERTFDVFEKPTVAQSEKVSQQEKVAREEESKNTKLDDPKL